MSKSINIIHHWICHQRGHLIHRIIRHLHILELLLLNSNFNTSILINWTILQITRRNLHWIHVHRHHRIRLQKKKYFLKFLIFFFYICWLRKHLHLLHLLHLRRLLNLLNLRHLTNSFYFLTTCLILLSCGHKNIISRLLYPIHSELALCHLHHLLKLELLLLYYEHKLLLLLFEELLGLLFNYLFLRVLDERLRLGDLGEFLRLLDERFLDEFSVGFFCDFRHFLTLDGRLCFLGGGSGFGNYWLVL